MGRNNTRAAKSIAKMYEQLGLPQDDIFHKTKLLLSIYRDVVWATLSDCRCVNAEINYYGDDLNDALIYLEEFAPDIERSEFEHRVCNLFENKWMIDLIDEIENNALYCAVCKLNPDQKELLTLLYRDGYTLSEVANRIYHTSVAAVSLRLTRMQKRIRRSVAENGGLRND